MRLHTINVKFRVRITVIDDVIGNETFYLYGNEYTTEFVAHRLAVPDGTETQVEIYTDDGEWINY